MAANLARLHLMTFGDVLFHLPTRYEDRTRLTPIAALRPGDRVLIEGNIVNVAVAGRRRSLICRVADDSGTLTLRFFHFNQAQYAALNSPGAAIRCFGECRQAFRSGLEMTHPEYRVGERVGALAVSERLTPIYPMTKGVTQATLRRIVKQVLQQLTAFPLDELLPPAMLASLPWQSVSTALQFIHHPDPGVDVDQLQQGLHPAQLRLVFEELLAHQVGVRTRRAQRVQQRAPVLTGTRDLVGQLTASLPFTLTGAQQRVCATVLDEVARGSPMLRLVQGDVGSGKTVVAAIAAAMAIDSGYQVALMAPTELLAEQHHRNFTTWMAPLGCRVALLTGSVGMSARRGLLTALQAGDIDIVIGTHALFQSSVEIARLGLMIVDEQHRFGVDQRLALQEKGKTELGFPHQLVMSATPIPRTLAMTAYGDLDCSVIDELPPGREPVTTLLISRSRKDEVMGKVLAHAMQGKQVYWVCTLVEESEALQAQAAEVAADELSAALPDLTIGLIHGRMKAEDKAAMMQAYLDRQVDVLVATTVIEVGVDVANASLMVIENAERLGLAQLHQLRGRIGRGPDASYCLLLFESPLSAVAERRLQIMQSSHDGFAIAEQDLAMRGPGELLGTRQSGLMQFKMADLVRDSEVVTQVSSIADQVAGDAELVSRLSERWLSAVEKFMTV